MRNVQKNKISSKKWKEANREHVNAEQRTWRRLNPLSINQSLALLLRVRIGKIVSGKLKAGSAVSDLGCSIEELRSHLECKFQPDMSWDNRGRKGWHIDHIKPLSSFDLTNLDEFKKACHFTNLQPLWWQDNLRKGGA